MINKKFKKNKLIILAVLFAVTITSFFFAKSSSKGLNFCINESYKMYKHNYLSKDGRIMDPQRNNVSISEGQSYIMLGSVFQNDRRIFDLSYKWTKDNLKRPDNLFSWLWGENKKGEYKILDANSATDADIDIAFALILAYEKWHKKKYLDDAILIINSIWNKETRQIGNYLVLMPGAAQATSDKIEINPSYFAPYPFRMFQKYDKTHDWNKLIDSSYYYLNEATKKTKTGLPPDWFLIENGKIVLENSSRSDFSYDAIRVFPRLLIDYNMTGEKRALPILAKSKFFIDKWKKSKKLYTNYKANGELKDNHEFIGSIAVLIPVIALYDEVVAKEIYNQEIMTSLEKEKNSLAPDNYYGRSLAFFGCYLYKNPKGIR